MDTVYIFDSPNEPIQLEYKHKPHDIISKSLYTSFAVLKKEVWNYKPDDPSIRKIISLDIKIDSVNYSLLLVRNGKCGYLHYTGEHDEEAISYTVFHCNNLIVNGRVQFGWFLDAQISPYLYSIIKEHPDWDQCKKEIFLYKYNLNTLSLLGNYLEIGGNFMHSFMMVCKSFQLEYMYLLTFMFKRVILLDGKNVCCYEFLGNTYISQKELSKLIHTPFTIKNKMKDYVELSKHIQTVYKYYTKVYGYLLKGNTDKYLDNVAYSVYKKVNLISNTFIKNEMYKLIIDVLNRTYRDDKIVKVSSSIKSHEGTFIEEIIQRYHCKSCLEIGMGFGVSAMYILGYSTTTLISIDPFQHSRWNTNGIDLLKRMGVISRHHLITEDSFIALPALLKTHTFDLIFIDGWHTFDDTLNDFFYSIKLLNTPGIIIIDNAIHPSVNKCIKYIEVNYTQCRRLVSPSTMACFKKVKDNRDEEVYVNF
jgi:predicted O-methyltransferase YrrM